VVRLRMLGAALAFWVTFAICVGIITLSGHSMTARWHVGPIAGRSLWWVLVTSPEILIFLFFMITDPKTSPRRTAFRTLYGAAVAFLAAVLIAPQRTEFATKVAILGALAIVCAAGPLCRRLVSLAGSEPTGVSARTAGPHAVHPGPPARSTGEDRGAITRRKHMILTIAAGIGAVGMCGGLLVVANIPARSTRTAIIVDRGQIANRPLVRLDPSAIPPVTIVPDVNGAGLPFNEQTARRIAEDLVADLIIEADALKRHDPTLAATGATGPWLQARVRDIAVTPSGGPLTAPTYRFDHIAVLLIRDPKQPQASPKVGVAVRGSVFLPAGAPYNRTFAVVLAGGHYLIESDSP
jgi:hypothetical protein